MRGLFCALAVSVCLICAPAAGQSPPPADQDPVTEDLSGLVREAEGDYWADTASPSVRSCETAANPDVRKACEAYAVADFEYATFARRHTADVLLWQLLTSKLIFFVVLLIVAIGLYFSWRQFSVSMRSEVESQSSTIELGTTGFKVTSPVLGVIILALSLGFFYLYLVHVYPVSNVD